MSALRKVWKGLLGKPFNVEKPPSAQMTCMYMVMGEEEAGMKPLRANLGGAGQVDPSASLSTRAALCLPVLYTGDFG